MPGGWSLVIGDRREKRGPAIEGPAGRTARAETAVFENGSKKPQKITAARREEDSTLRHRGHRADGINGKRSFSREPKASAWGKKAPRHQGKMKARRHAGTQARRHEGMKARRHEGTEGRRAAARTQWAMYGSFPVRPGLCPGFFFVRASIAYMAYTRKASAYRRMPRHQSPTR